VSIHYNLPDPPWIQDHEYDEHRFTGPSDFAIYLHETERDERLDEMEADALIDLTPLEKD
jgi:hypothetical protein